MKRHRLLCVLLVAARAALVASMYPLNLAAAAELLEVKLPSARATVRAAYRKKAAKAHPDVSHAADAAANFLRITTAYETLLQFSYVAPAPAKRPTAASPQPHATQHYSGHGEKGSDEAELFGRRVAAWREYWQATLLATQLASEAERKSAQEAVLAHELDEIREQLDKALLAPWLQSTIDDCRARYARASSEHADLSCAVQTLRGRARAQRAEAARLEEYAQHFSTASDTGFAA